MTEQELLERWLSSKKPYVKPSTYALYRRICFKNILPKCQMFGLQNGCKELEDSLLEQYRPKTAKDIALVVNQVLKFAKQQGVITEFYKIKILNPKQRASRIKVLNRYEQDTLTRYLFSHLDYSELGVLLSLYTGLRLGEICGLQVRDIDLNAGIIRITKTVQRICDEEGHSYHYFGAPKTDCSEREIPIPDFLSKLLTRFLSELPKDYYVATGKERFVQPRTYQNRLKTYFRKCNLTEYHFHTLRHTFATRAVELGFEIKALSEILGHANVKITLNLYVHPSIEQKKAEMEKFAVFI